MSIICSCHHSNNKSHKFAMAFANVKVIFYLFYGFNINDMSESICVTALMKMYKKKTE